MLYTDALAETRARLQELTADFWTDDELYRAINEGVNRFVQEEKWPYLFTIDASKTLSAGATSLVIESGVAFERQFNILMLFDGDLRPRAPRRVSPAEGHMLRLTYYNTYSEPLAYYIASQTGTGVAGAVTGSYLPTIRFVPALTRDADIEIMYIRDPVIVTSSFSTKHLDIPDEYAMAAVAYATGHAFLKELNFSQKADEQFALYRKIVDDAKRESRKLVPDMNVFAWGKTQPEYGPNPGTDSEWAWNTPLGP